MRLARFFAPDLVATLQLGVEESHHATGVLRLRSGDEVELFDGKGGAGRYRIAGAGKRGVSLELAGRTDENREPDVSITLAFAPPRPKRALALIEKATELGAARFVPLETRRTRVALGPKAIEKLRRRAVEACKQCGRNVVPAFEASTTVDQLARFDADLKLLPDARGGAPLGEAVRAGARSVVYAIGPEGGFEEDERALLRDRGFVAVTLGKSILRVETAAVALLACLVSELG